MRKAAFLLGMSCTTHCCLLCLKNRFPNRGFQPVGESVLGAISFWILSDTKGKRGWNQRRTGACSRQIGNLKGEGSVGRNYER